MTDSQKLLELAERCEKAEGPDRELDEAIACLFAKSHPVFGKPIAMVYAKQFTASLDAALTLVPEGFRWKLGYSRHVPCVAEIVDYRIQMEPNLGRFVSECDNSHALALVAAALRARAAQIEPPVCECDNAEVDGCPIHWK